MTDPTSHELRGLVPTTLLRRLAPAAGPLQPWQDNVEAAVLFADVSGFTAMAEHLATYGPAGAERLTDALNSVFAALLDPIAARGGEVVAFAGDAAVVLFPAEAGASLAEATATAFACGLDVQTSMAARVPVGDERLAVRIGVACGTVWLGCMGGASDRWLFLAAGDPIAEMGPAAAAAVPGGVVATTQAHALVTGDPWAAGVGGHRPVTAKPPTARSGGRPPPDLAPAQVRAFIPRTVLSRIDARQSDWVAEFRRVSVLFVRVDGLDVHAPDMLARAHAAASALQEHVYHFGGSVVQWLVDDKGTVFVAAWGLPDRTHADDAQRAALAAGAALDAVRPLGLRASAGVTTGTVFAGMRGTWVRREYALIGAVVNRAARLMQGADGGVLVDRETATAAPRLLFAPAAALPGKRQGASIAAFRVVGVGATASRHTAAPVGRDAETLALRSIVRDHPTSVPRVVTVCGEAGIGKSHFVDHVVADVRERGWTVLLGASDDIERSTPYFVWRAPLRALFADTPDAEIADRLVARLGEAPHLIPWAPLLSGLLPIELPDNDVTRQMVGESRGAGIRDLVVQLLKHATATTPTLLVLDDAHWFDSASWALVAQVARQVPGALLLLATRPLREATPPDYAALTAAGVVQEVELKALGADGTARLAAQALGVEEIPANVSAFIFDRAAGNPLFTEQLTLALREAGHLVVDAGTCRLAGPDHSLAALALPTTVQGVITSRVDRLPAPQQLTLKVASVIGRVFALASLTATHPMVEDRPTIPSQLDDLARLDLVALDAPSAELSYLFNHVLVQEVLYDMLTFAQRRKLHRALAEFVESRFANNLDGFLPLLAHHYERADDVAKALGYLERAATHALDNNANAEATRFIATAVALDERQPGHADDARRSRWHWTAAVGHLKLQAWDPCTTAIATSMRQLGQPLPASKLGVGMSLVGGLTRQLLHRLAPSWFLGRGASKVEILQAANLQQRRSEVAWSLNDVLTLLDSSFATLNLAEQAAEPNDMAPAYGSIATTWSVIGLRPLARYYVALTLSTAARATHRPSEAYARLLVGVALNGSGDYETVVTQELLAAEAFERLGDRMRWETAHIIIAVADISRGQFREAFDRTELVWRSCAPNGSPTNIGWCAAHRAHAAIRLGELADAHVHALEAAIRLELNPPTLGLGLGILSFARRVRNDLPGALAAAREALAIVRREQPVVYYAVDGLDAIALTFVEALKGQPDAALLEEATFATRSLTSLARIYPLARARAAYCRGQLAAAQGDAAGARRYYTRAVDEAVRWGARFDAERARLELTA